MPSVDPQLIVLATLVGSLLLFVTDALRYDLVALGVVVILAGTRCLTPEQAFAGLSSPAVVLIGSMYVFGHAVTRWGVTESISQRMLIGEGQSESRLALRVTIVAGLLSSVLSNTGVVAAMIPVLSTVARRQKIPVSRLLLPLSYGSLLGGLISVLGTSTNIAINGVIADHHIEPFSLFEFSWLGLVLLCIGGLYFLGPGRSLLPRSRLRETLSEHYQLPKFVTEVLVEPSSTLINRLVAETGFHGRYDISVLGIVRPGEENAVLAPGPYNRIRRDDVLIVQGDPEAILRLREDLGLRQRESVQVGDTRLDSADVLLVEAVVPAGSALAGSTLHEADFRAATGVNVMAISRHGSVRPTRISHTELDVGDTLLLQGHRRDVERLRRSRQLLVLEELDTPAIGRGGIMTLVLLGLVLVLGALTTLPLSIAALGGALGLVLTRTVKADEALRHIDWSVLILTGGMLALGMAFEIHGLGTWVAIRMAELGSQQLAPWLVIGALLLCTTLLTQVMNNVSTAVIMAPVAIHLAQELGVPERATLMAVLAGASFAFMSPVAHQANAMVMGPGDYRYRDFLRAGTPLTLLLVVVATPLIALWWG